METMGTRQVDSRMKILGTLRVVARQLGVGRFLLRITALRQTGVRATLTRSIVRKYVLPEIRKAPALGAGTGAMELHMLLNKARLWEGAWALYSFLYYAAQPLRVVVHSDGTLDGGCASILSGLFPGIHIIPRAEADGVVTATLKEQGLNQCIELRRRHILGLKLLDPFIYSCTPSYLMLDSDLLTFSKPSELLDPSFAIAGDLSPHLYSPDCSDSMALAPEKLRLAGFQPAYRLNSGLLKIQRNGLSLARIEETISKLNLLRGERVSFYAEQTLYACELPRHGAMRLDPERYTICGNPNERSIVTGHYCGEYYMKTLFYREGIPRLATALGIAQQPVPVYDT